MRGAALGDRRFDRFSRQRRRRRIGGLLASALLLWTSLSVVRVSAQPATPEPVPIAPDPAACVVSPLPIEQIAATLATPMAGSPAGTPALAATPTGRSADEETTRAVTDTLRQLFACTNAGDYLRVYAFFSHRFLREFFAGTTLTDDVVAFLSAPPQPLPTDKRRIIRGIGPVYLLPDGRATVRILLDEPNDPPRGEAPDDVILIWQDGRWLVDAIAEG